MSEPTRSAPGLGRRRLLRGGAALGLAGLLPLPALAARREAPRTLAFHMLRSDEVVSATYWADGRYHADALARIDHVLRDVRTDEVKTIDRRLIDLVYELHRTLGGRAPYQVISGYRSAKTNAMLAARSGGVATHSLHMDGMAIDLSLPDVPLSDLRRAAIDLGGGGVGYYPRSNFVHVDTGRVRSW